MGDLVAAEPIVQSFCTFRADGRLYGISLTHLREVSTIGTITPVPHAPPGVRGLTNLRSRIYLVLDLRCLLGLQPATCTDACRLVIFKTSVVEDLGLLVDSGGDIVRVAPDQIELTNELAASTPRPSGASAPLVVGVCKLETELMMLIDPMRFADAIAKAFI